MCKAYSCTLRAGLPGGNGRRHSVRRDCRLMCSRASNSGDNSRDAEFLVHAVGRCKTTSKGTSTQRNFQPKLKDRSPFRPSSSLSTAGATDGTGFPRGRWLRWIHCQTTVWIDELVAFDASVHGSTLQRPMPSENQQIQFVCSTCLCVSFRRRSSA
jgi:hypothetical protein